MSRDNMLHGRLQQEGRVTLEMEGTVVDRACCMTTTSHSYCGAPHALGSVCAAQAVSIPTVHGWGDVHDMLQTQDDQLGIYFIAFSLGRCTHYAEVP
jgi:hypothetical protein